MKSIDTRGFRLIFAPVIRQQDDYPSGELQITKWGMMVLEKDDGDTSSNVIVPERLI